MKLPQPRLSIRSQLLLLVLAFALPAAAMLTYFLVQNSRDAAANAYAKVNILAASTAAHLDLILHEHEPTLERLAARPQVRSLDPRNCDPMVADYVALHPEFTRIGVRDKQGNLMCSVRAGPSTREQIAGLTWFQDGMRASGFRVGDAYLGQSSGHWLSVLTYPIRDDAGQVSGLVSLAINLGRLNQQLFQHAPKNAVQAVFDREDRFVLRSIDPDAWIGKRLPEAHAAAVRGRTEGVFFARGVDGVQRLYAFVTVPNTGWRVFAGMPEDEVFAEYWSRLRPSIGISIAALLFALLLAWRIGSAITKPTRELADTAARIAGGDTAARVRVRGPLEIEYVAQQFNDMLDSQDRQREERAALVSHYGQLVKLARDIFLLMDASGNLVEANDAAAVAYGYSMDELRGMNLRSLRAPEALISLERDWQATMRPEGVLFETVHRRKDGSTFPVEVSSRVIDIEGKPYRQSFVRDITARKAAELQIRRLSSAYATLSETNQAIVRLHRVEELYPRICRIAVEFGGYVGAWIGLVDEPSQRILPVAIDGGIDDYVRQINISTDAAQPQGRGPTAVALREDCPYYCDDFLKDPITEPWRALARAFGIRAAVALPLRRGGKAIGTLTLYSAEPEVFDASMRALLEEMATDVSFALDNFEREAARKQVEQALRESEERFRGMLEQNISAMFVIEDGALTYINQRASEILGYAADELIGRSILDLIAVPDRPSVADGMRQLLSGELKIAEREVCAVRKDGTSVDVGVHGVIATLQGRQAILGMAQDIGERKKAQAEIDRYIARLERAMQSTLTAVSLMVELRDPYTAGHERRVGELAAAIGAEMGLSENTVKGLRLAGYVHDIGKINVPAEILSKPSRLTPMEFALIKGHAQAGHDVLQGVDFPWPVAQVILQHHERLDGSGYPRQLKNGEIILEARIMAVADVVEAMSSHRPYRPGLGIDSALEEVATNSGRIYDAEVAAACLRLFRDKGYVLPA